ncbi:hypothetical protein A3D70_00025 [Candidatus Adlerbacteria bacterium RIFCSPHIGHO2_02_FULL_54_18]|uniref:DUF5678 domain-containing protein n=1 Tax=Candidatus Adlerbacteria bacterium RIFCSPHIGHO2_02_FULL_54_18 TaxID=1797241 RepID=A0A1F4Y1V2_9BACT|nr:MAG: hypothetical protein A3D70_00025 [Candidatus Adlerbacteria bacterium RIFCSPHIGHO2_02_FULL_54_18]
MKSSWATLYKTHKGLWVALLDDNKTVVGKGKTIAEAKKSAEKKGHKEVFLLRVPEKSFSFVG